MSATAPSDVAFRRDGIVMVDDIRQGAIVRDKQGKHQFWYAPAIEVGGISNYLFDTRGYRIEDVERAVNACDGRLSNIKARIREYFVRVLRPLPVVTFHRGAYGGLNVDFGTRYVGSIEKHHGNVFRFVSARADVERPWEVTDAVNATLPERPRQRDVMAAVSRWFTERRGTVPFYDRPNGWHIYKVPYPAYDPPFAE